MGLYIKEESTRWKSCLLLCFHLEWSLGAFKNCCIFNEKPSWEPFKNLSWTKQIPLNELISSRWPHSNKFNRGKGGIQTEREKYTFQINIAVSSWEDWNYTTPWRWNVRASFCALPQCSTFQAAQHEWVPIFTVAVLQLCLHWTAANPVFQNMVSKPVVKNPDIWSHIVTQGRAVDHRTKLVKLLHLFLSIWKEP